MLFNLPYPEVTLSQLKTYTCREVDNSLIRKYILSPFVYEPLVSRIPRSVSPNQLTLLGFFFAAMSTLLCYLFSPDFSNGRVFRLAFLLNGLLLFVYQTLNNVDGKQARRINYCTPLGDVLDHVVDSLVISICALNWMTLCAAGPSFLSFSILVFALLGFGFATWERYYVGGLYLPILNMPIEGLLFIELVFVVTGVFGHSIWSYTLKDMLSLFSYFPSIISNIELRFLVIVFTCITSLVCIYFNINNVSRAILQNQRQLIISPDKTRERDFYNAVKSLYPLALLLSFSTMWLLTSQSDIFRHHPYLFCLAIGLEFAYYSSNIIVSHVLKERLDKLSLTTWLPCFLCLLNSINWRVSKTGIIEESYALYIFGFFAFSLFSWYMLAVCFTFSRYLNIGIWNVKRPSD